MTEIVPLNIDNLPERLSFIETNRLYSVRNNLINSSRMGSFNWLPAEWLPFLDSKYDEAADHIADVYIGTTKETVQLGAAIAKANMWREAGLFDKESQQLEMVLQARMDEESSRNPITAIIEEALAEAQEKAAQSDKA